MEFFISDKQQAKTDPEFRFSNSYLEIEVPFTDETSGYLYILQRSESSAFVLVCLDEMFDSMLNDLNEDSLETIAETWPTLMDLIVNGVNEKFQNGALIRMEDPDFCDNKWFVASIAGNISFDSIEDLMCERMNQTISVVFDKSVQLLTELQERQPSMLKAVGKGIINGAIIALLSAFDPDDIDYS